MLLAASVLVTGFTGAFVYSPSAYGITSVDELSDVDRSSWAFDALRDLVEKYNVIEGYPDKTFRGNHKASRYEMAAALNALIRHIGKDIARLGTEKADKEDLAKLAKLQEEFKAELAALQARTDALEARAAKIEAKNEEQDNRLTVLEKLKIYGDVTIGGFADMGGNGGNGTPFAGGGRNTYAYDANSGRYVPAGQAANTTDGLSDSISALGRVRVNIDYPIVEDEDGEGAIGEGTIHTRIVGAYGRVSPLLAGGDLAKGGTGSGMLSGISRVTGDTSLFNEGVRASQNQTGVGLFGRNAILGSNTRANLYLESAYYTQEFRDGIPLLTDILPGVNLLPDDENWKLNLKLKMGLIPWREIFQKSPYTGDETTQFQNTAIVNNAAIPVNAVAPTLAFEWHQGLGEWHSLDVKTALSSIDVSDAMSSIAITYEGSLNYNWGWLADWLDHPGNIYAGGWWMNGRGGNNSLIAGNTPFNGTTMGSAQDMVRGFSENPLQTITSAAGPAGFTPVLQNAVAANMGLAAGSLGTRNTLAAALGVTVAQLANPQTVLPNATIAAINASGTYVGTALPQGTTLAAYYNEIMTNAGVPLGTGGPSQGQLPTGDDKSGLLDVNDNAYGFYAGLNQELHRGAGVFFSYGVVDSGPQSLLVSALQNGTGTNSLFNAASGLFGRGSAIYGVKQSMNMGIEIPMKALHLPWRHKDVWGFAYAQLKPQDAFGSAFSGTPSTPGTVMTGGLWQPNNVQVIGIAPHAPVFNNIASNGVAARTRSFQEHIMEMYYKVHINDRFSITPNVQFIINRLGDPSNDLMTVVGLRTTFKF